MKFFEYFKKIGIRKREADIYLALYQLGNQPASVVAKYIQKERTYVYKILLKFAEMNLVSTTEKNGVKHFFIPDISILKRYVQNKMNTYKSLEEEYSAIEAEMAQYNNKYSSSIPKISLYDGIDGTQNMYSDMHDIIEKKGLISIKFFSSNTLDTRGIENGNLKFFAQDFFQKLSGKKVQVDTFLGNGMMIMESVGRAYKVEDIEKLPAANSAINIFVVGTFVYIIIFKEIPVGIKIDSPELANSLHFIFEKMNIH